MGSTNMHHDLEFGGVFNKQLKRFVPALEIHYSVKDLV
jgi:hypothetical protein